MLHAPQWSSYRWGIPRAEAYEAAGATNADWLLALLVGLLILTVARFVPYLEGLVHFVVICLGLGAFAWQIFRVSRPAITTRTPV